MRRLADELRRQGRVGLVPTMGALHDGHLALVRRARRACDRCVVSIFVNPMQFGPKEDFRRYPRPLRRDLELLAAAGVDVAFCPRQTEMYPSGFATSVEVARLTRHLCGASRPGHFRGVTTVVAKLFNIVKPHLAVFGQKDAQQAFVLRRMARDLNYDLTLLVAPTVRGKDGLAMSSRNHYLTARQRSEAPVLYRALCLARALVRAGERDATKLKLTMRRVIEAQSGGNVDYVEITDTRELTPIRRVTGEVLVALAVRFGRTRLIDNLILRT